MNENTLKMFKWKSISFYRFIFHVCIMLVFALGLPLIALLNGPPPSDAPFSAEPIVQESEIIYHWAILSSTIVPFYFINAYLLIPGYLVARKYLAYGALLLVLCLATLGISKYLSYLLASKGMMTTDLPMPAMLLPMVLLLGLSISFEMILNWEYQKRTQESIQKEKITAELSFLKSQINPHFLFNTLNNIYSLSERQSEKTGQSIILLSNLMRYILYDTTDGKISLSSEIKHLEEYIALQRMRVVEMSTVTIDLDIQVRNDSILIEPLLLIPFVENAFKHGISYTSPSFIKMELSLVGSFLNFKVINSKRHSNGMSVTNIKHQGVGIANTSRRLQLLYPGRHELRIMNESKDYTVQLALQL